MYYFNRHHPPCEGEKPLRHTGLQSVEELGTEILIKRGKRKTVIRMTVDSDCHYIYIFEVSTKPEGSSTSENYLLRTFSNI